MPRFFWNILFCIALIALSWLFRYPDELLQRPNSFHVWRQCDGAQFAMNYYEVSMNFFEPRLNVLIGNGGKMVSEFPIIYYAAACLYKIFGPHECIIRLLSLSIFFAGLFCLFKTISLLLSDNFYALLLALIPFTSAVVSDYAFSFLSDVPALSLTFIGYFFFIKFWKQKRETSLMWATLFFTLAGLLKITSLVGYIAILAVLAFRFLFGGHRDWLPYKKTLSLFFCLPLLISCGWVLYAKYYNLANHNTYFLLQAMPIWNADKQTINEVFHRFDRQWLRMYLYRDFLHTLPFLFLLCFLIPAKNKTPLLVWLLLSVLGGACYFFLFFTQFFHHDYYIICLMFLPVAVLTVLLMQIKSWKSGFFSHWSLRASLVLLITVLFYHGIRINKERDSGAATEQFSEFRYIEPQLEKLGISKNDKVISIGDKTTGVSLYLMNRKGWTEVMEQKPLSHTFIQSCIDKGAGYLFIYKDTQNHLDSLSQNAFTGNFLADINGIKIYKL